MRRASFLLIALVLGLFGTFAFAGEGSPVDIEMEKLMVRLPEPQTLSEMNGPGFQDANGRHFLLTHLQGIAYRLLVPLGEKAVPDLIRYLDHQDVKIRFLAEFALKGITDAYMGGNTNDCMDVNSAGHARMVAAYREWLTRATETARRPDPRFTYSTRLAGVAMAKEANWVAQRQLPVLLSDGKVGLLSGSGDIGVAVFDPQQDTLVCRKGGRARGWQFQAIPLPEDQVLLLADGLCTTYDFRGDTFQAIDQSCPLEKRYGYAWLSMPDGKVFFCGGETGDQKSPDCVLFDPGTRSFTSAGTLVVARSGATATSLGDGRILVAGGVGEGEANQPSLASLEVFDLNTQRSTLLKVRMTIGRTAHSAVRLADGNVLLAGGWNMGEEVHEVQQAEVFDPTAGRVVPVGSMALRRSCTYASPLPSGRVALFGGSENGRVVEVYCPEEQMFIIADQLLRQPRKWLDGQPLVLKDGRILLAGGRPNSSSEVLTGLEILAETESTTRPAAGLDAEQLEQVTTLVRALQSEDYEARDSATRALIGMGARIKPDLVRLSRRADPEVAARVATIVKALSPITGKTAMWCVDVCTHAGATERIFLPRYPDAEQFGPLTQRLAQGKVKQLIVRFPPLYLYEQQGFHLELVGGTRFPEILLGPPLAPNEGYSAAADDTSGK